MCSFLGCNLSIPFSLGEAVPLRGETGSYKMEYIMLIKTSLLHYYVVSLFNYTGIIFYVRTGITYKYYL